MTSQCHWPSCFWPSLKHCLLKVRSQGFLPGKKGNKGKDSAGKSSEGQGQTKEVCRQFSSEKGCSRGNACKYVHQTQSGMSGRCFNCLGKHLKTDCTSPGGGSTPKAEEAGCAAPKPKIKKTQGGSAAANCRSPSSAGPSGHVAQAGTIKVVGSNLLPEDFGTGVKGLIDGGATSCLRVARNLHVE